MQAAATPAADGGAGAPGAGGGSPLSSLIMFGGIIVIFYFFMIRPQQRRQKEEAKFRSSLQKGDKVITIGGISGKIVSVEDDFIMLEVDQNVKLRVKKSAVSPDTSGEKSSK